MSDLYYEIFKIDTKGNVRVWRMEQEGSRYRTISGLQSGKHAVTGWTQAEATNVGRSNERDPVAQASFEIAAEYTKNLDRDYHRTIEGARGGAHFFEPMLAEKYKEFAPGFAQPKLDGIRCIAKADGLWSRQGKPIMGAPHIAEVLTPLFQNNPSLILDGELYNHSLKDDFNTIVSVVKKQKPDAEDLEKSKALVQYHVYDMPSHSGVFRERTKMLGKLIQGYSPTISRVETRIITGSDEYDEFHGSWLEAGYEGSMWRADAPYEQKRSKTLRKRKAFQDEDFPISQIIEGDGNWAGYAKVVEYILPGDKRLANGERPKATLKGSQEFARKVLKEAEEYAGSTVTVQFFAYTPDGIPRFPVATKLYKGKRDL